MNYQQGDCELADRPRWGRPRLLQKHCAWLEHLLPQDPQTLGYRQTSWTVPLLQHHLGKQHLVAVSATTLRRTLHGLGYRWKLITRDHDFLNILLYPPAQTPGIIVVKVQ